MNFKGAFPPKAFYDSIISSIGVKAGLKEVLTPGWLLLPTRAQDDGACKGRIKHLLRHGRLSLCQPPAPCTPWPSKSRQPQDCLSGTLHKTII